MRKITLASTIVFILASFTSYPELIRAQTSSTAEPVQLGFKQPDYSGDAPKGRDRGTGSRGDCAQAASGTQGEITLTPLIPSDSRGLTTNESPTVWVRVDYSSNQIDNEISGEFSLEDAQTYLKFPPKQIPVTLPKTSGVFSIPIPHSLAVNQWYRWYLVVDCDRDSESNSVLSVEGMVQRVELAEKSQLETQSPQERVAIYANQGIWYDALDEAARLGCNNSSNAATDYWTALLSNEQVKLNTVAQGSLICR